jgi:hypothetical protein
MAKRAIERLDQELAGKTALVLEREQAAAALAALETPGTDPRLAALRESLAAALAETT